MLYWVGLYAGGYINRCPLLLWHAQKISFLTDSYCILLHIRIKSTSTQIVLHNPVSQITEQCTTWSFLSKCLMYNPNSKFVCNYRTENQVIIKIMEGSYKAHNLQKELKAHKTNNKDKQITSVNPLVEKMSFKLLFEQRKWIYVTEAVWKRSNSKQPEQ